MNFATKTRSHEEKWCSKNFDQKLECSKLIHEDDLQHPFFKTSRLRAFVAMNYSG